MSAAESSSSPSETRAGIDPAVLEPVAELPDHRRVLEAILDWHARLTGRASFDLRRAETRKPEEVPAALSECFPDPNCESLKGAHLRLIELHEGQRAEIEQRIGVEWKTTDEARRRIRELVKSL